MTGLDVAACRSVLDEVLAERHRQAARYDNSHILDGTGPGVRWLLPYTTDSAEAVERKLRDDYEDFEAETGAPTWVHLVREEIAEAFKEDPALDNLDMDAELLQAAALLVSWVEERRRKRAAQ